MLSDARQSGSEFNEHSLGFRKFAEFVRTVSGVAIQDRSGSDILLAPATAGDLLAAYAGPLPRLRRDFWRAFVEFPVAKVARLYDPDEDKVVHVEAGSERSGIEIEPVPRETQLEWRKTFSQEQPDPIRDSLLAALNAQGTAIFNEFARRLRENPTVMRTCVWEPLSTKADYGPRDGMGAEIRGSQRTVVSAVPWNSVLPCRQRGCSSQTAKHQPAVRALQFL